MDDRDAYGDAYEETKKYFQAAKDVDLVEMIDWPFARPMTRFDHFKKSVTKDELILPAASQTTLQST